jgi:hypothetical protein
MKTIIIIISWISIHTYFRPSDYRDSYTGYYICKQIYRHVNSSYQFVNDTTNYTLTVNKSDIDSMLTIITREGNLTVKLVGNNFKNPIGRHCFGRFSGDSIYVTNIPSAGPNTFVYFGRK